FLAKSAAVCDSTWPVSMPSSVFASVKPLYDVWLNDLSSKPPESDTMQALKAAPPALALGALAGALGAAEEAPVPGGSAQLVRVRAAVLIRAPARVRMFFT